MFAELWKHFAIYKTMGLGVLFMFFKRKKSKLHKIIAYISENPQTT